MTKTITRRGNRVKVKRQVCTAKLVSGPVKFTTVFVDEVLGLAGLMQAP